MLYTYMARKNMKQKVRYVMLDWTEYPIHFNNICIYNYIDHYSFHGDDEKSLICYRSEYEGLYASYT